MTTSLNNNNKLFQKILVGFYKQEDPIKAMLEWMIKELMEIEVQNSKLGINTDKGIHNKNRQTFRNGYRVRNWNTRMGTLYVVIPKVRTGGYQPFFIKHHQRSESALLSIVQECYINGVSTRKMLRIAHSMGIENISSSQVSDITKGLDIEVNRFRNMSLDKEYPIVFIDAIYHKIRVDHKVISVAIMIALAIDNQGERKIIAIESMPKEAKETWGNFFEKLKKRGLEKIGLLVSDSHKGITSSAQEHFIGTSWQRCKVHFMRNIISKTPHKYKHEIAQALSLIFTQKNIHIAKQHAQFIIKKFEDIAPQAMDCLSEGLEDSLQFYHFKNLPFNRISSTNHLERLNREIRRRSNVVGIFPSISSFLRLIGAYLIEYQDEWESSRSYIDPKKLNLLDSLKSFDSFAC